MAATGRGLPGWVKRWLAILLVGLCGWGAYLWHRARPPRDLIRPSPVSPSGTARIETPPGRLYEVNGYPVLELSGTPEEMGEAHGRLVGDTIRRVVADVLRPETEPARHARILKAAAIMERYQPEPYRRELAALAKAAGVDYMEMAALQLFGDAERGRMPREDVPAEDVHQCSHYAVFGPATETGECIVGRNFDYWYEDVARYASLLIYYRPADGNDFVTVSWAGVINGWSLMNEHGLVGANNNAYSSDESLAGISTCFLQRLIMENAATVAEGIEIARRGPRAVGTVMLLAGGDPPDAVELEFDHAALVVRPAKEGYVLATNAFRAFGLAGPLQDDPRAKDRYGTLLNLILKNHGRIGRDMNFAAAPGVPMWSINLHCAMFFPSDRTFLVSMGKAPASNGPFRRFRMTEAGIVGTE